jgi:c-di-GMP-binding flagellar brake protein YcgR
MGSLPREQPVVEPTGDSSGARWKVVRAFPRFALDIAFTLQATGATPGTLRGRMLDISLGGFGGELSTEVAVRQKLAAEFLLPGASAPLQAKVIVRYHRESRYGFEFLDITPEQRDQIRQACRNLPML